MTKHKWRRAAFAIGDPVLVRFDREERIEAGWFAGWESKRDLRRALVIFDTTLPLRPWSVHNDEIVGRGLHARCDGAVT